MGRTAGYKRTGVCGGLRADAVCLGSVHRERTDEVGFAGCYHPVHLTVVGKELHGTDGFLHRLCADVCQVPHGGFHIGNRRVYHSATGHACTKDLGAGLQGCKGSDEIHSHQLCTYRWLLSALRPHANTVLPELCVFGRDECTEERITARVSGSVGGESY